MGAFSPSLLGLYEGLTPGFGRALLQDVAGRVESL